MIDLETQEVRDAIKMVLQFAIDHHLEIDFIVHDKVSITHTIIVQFKEVGGSDGKRFEVMFKDHNVVIDINIEEIKSIYFNTNVRANSLDEFKTLFDRNLKKSNEESKFIIYFDKEDHEKFIFRISYFCDPRHKNNS